MDKIKCISLMGQHKMTGPQIEFGCVDAPDEIAGELHQLGTFDSIPEGPEFVRLRAERMAEIAWDLHVQTGCDLFMIGGALWLQRPLQEELERMGLRWCYAFSQRRVVERRTEQGVKKETVFVFEGIYPKL